MKSFKQYLQIDETFYVGKRSFKEKWRADRYAKKISGVVTPEPNPTHKGFNPKEKAAKVKTPNLGTGKGTPRIGPGQFNVPRSKESDERDRGAAVAAYHDLKKKGAMKEDRTKLTADKLVSAVIEALKFDVGKEVRAIARERVGQPPRRQVIRSKKDKPPKHKERHDY